MTWNPRAFGAEIAVARTADLASVVKPRLRTGLWGSAVIAVAALTAACGSGGAAAGYGGGGGNPAGAGQQPAASHRPVVVVREVAKVGTVLVDRSGKTIYSPQQEAHGRILCTGSCLGFWFPVSVRPGTQLHAPQGIRGMLGTIHRKDDGVTQLTFNGRPLYTFRLDQVPGQVHGNNFSDSFAGRSFTWQVVPASGAHSSSTHSANPGGGYSYPATGAYGN
jgi:predicted lipoprotein with Yx(FWY)xxD motif